MTAQAYSGGCQYGDMRYELSIGGARLDE